MYKLIEVLFCY